MKLKSRLVTDILRFLSPLACRRELLAGREIAMLDLREEQAFGSGHPLFAANLSLGTLELTAFDRLPRRNVRIVVYDDDEAHAVRGARLLAELGYTDVHILEGGLSGWWDAGYELFTDLHSWSKAFGELMAEACATPCLAPEDLKAMRDRGERPIVVDARPADEFVVMNIPGAVNVPGAELVMQAGAFAPDPEALLVVNCAGRTRSLIGAQSLINAGVPNRVMALRDGTMGWVLAGEELEHGATRRAEQPDPESAAAAAARARRVAYLAGVKRLAPADLAVLAQDASRTLYRFDVRLPEDYQRGHIPGFLNAPGGQLVQETDTFAPVRGARIVLADDLGVRADMTASWLAQMGCEVYVLDGGFERLETGEAPPRSAPPPKVSAISVEILARRLADHAAVVVDLADSRAHKAGHVPTARFALRARLWSDLPPIPTNSDLVLTSADGRLASFAAAEQAAAKDAHILVLEGGTEAWAAAGLPLETGLDEALSPPDDVYKRPFEGVDAPRAMQAYLDWEHGLTAQLERDGTHGFRILATGARTG